MLNSHNDAYYYYCFLSLPCCNITPSMEKLLAQYSKALYWNHLIKFDAFIIYQLKVNQKGYDIIELTGAHGNKVLRVQSVMKTN
jgi:hypothetical protein